MLYHFTQKAFHTESIWKYSNTGMNRKRSLPNVSQSFDAGNYPKRRQITGVSYAIY
jgi:hypothetical protein